MGFVGGEGEVGWGRGGGREGEVEGGGDGGVGGGVGYGEEEGCWGCVSWCLGGKTVVAGGATDGLQSLLLDGGCPVLLRRGRMSRRYLMQGRGSALLVVVDRDRD